MIVPQTDRRKVLEARSPGGRSIGHKRYRTGRPSSRDGSARKVLRHPAPSKDDVGLKRLRMRNRHQRLGRFEHHCSKVFEPVDRRAQPLTSEPARHGPHDTTHSGRTFELITEHCRKGRKEPLIDSPERANLDHPLRRGGPAHAVNSGAIERR